MDNFLAAQLLPLRRFVRRLVPSWHDAEDIVQESFMAFAKSKMVQEIGENGPQGRLRAILFGITAHKITDFRRSQYRDKQVSLAETSEGDAEILATLAVSSAGSAEVQAMQQEVAESLREGIARLSQEDRVLLELHYFSQATIDEIASSRNQTSGAVRVALYRARQRLTHLIQRLE